jgi:hypothetical protein
MNQQVTLTVSDNVLLYAKTVAIQNRRRIEEVLADWLEKVSNESEVEKLSDAKILALANLQLPESQQETLHELLEKNGEGELTKLERKYLDELMEIHDDALLTKAKAMRIAVERGLMKPLSSE